MVLSFKQSAIVSRQKYSNAKNKEPHFKFKIEKSVSNQVKLISIIYRLLLNNEGKKEKISKKRLHDCSTFNHIFKNSYFDYNHCSKKMHMFYKWIDIRARSFCFDT